MSKDKGDLTTFAGEEDKIFETAINFGAKDCISKENFYEIMTIKEDFYKIKIELEKKIDHLTYSAIEWRALDYLKFDKEKTKKILDTFNLLEDLDDVQKIFTNVNLEI